MNLSEKIMDLRKKCGWSQEELAEKLCISRQSVSKWETGESTPDLDKIIRMSELWHVSTDYLLKDGISLEKQQSGTGTPEQKNSEEEAPEDGDGREETGGTSGGAVYGSRRQGRAANRRMVSGDEAEDFLALSRFAAPRIAVGVLLCILSPVCLLILGALTEKHPMLKGVVLVPENVAGGIGVTVLLLLVAIAVVLFITTGMRLSSYEYMEKELLELPQDVADDIYGRKLQFSGTFRYSITIGVVLCMVGVMALMLSFVFLEEDFVQVVGLCILLVFVGAGVFFLVHAGIIQSSFDKLLQVGDYTPGKKRMEGISGAYWSIVVAVYLLISLTGLVGWGSSWVIFPVAGVLFGGIGAILNHTSH